MIISLSNAYDTNLFTIKGINDTLTTIFNQKSNQIIKKKTDMSMGDAVKGKEIFVNRIKFYCDISDDEFLPIHTQDEWEALNGAGKFAEEAAKVCPGLKLKDKYVPHIYDFSYEYASDSGNVPSC